MSAGLCKISWYNRLISCTVWEFKLSIDFISLGKRSIDTGFTILFFLTSFKLYFVSLNNWFSVEALNLTVSLGTTSKSKMSKNKSLVGKKPYLFALYEVEGFDIDSKFEFNFAEYLYKKINKNG